MSRHEGYDLALAFAVAAVMTMIVWLVLGALA